MLVNVVVSVVTYFVTKYAAPELAKDVLFLIGAMQPVVIAVIVSITVQNVEYIKSDTRLTSEKLWAAEDAKKADAKPAEEVPQ
jgi:hypothetical protein